MAMKVARRRRDAHPAAPPSVGRLGRDAPADALPRPAWALGDAQPGLPAGPPVSLRAGASPVTVQLSTRALDDLEREYLRFPRVETGGLLLRAATRRDALVVTDAWPAGPAALHAPSRLELAWNTDLARAARCYAASQRTIAPAGAWHSHPESDQPSDQDLSIFSAILLRCQQIAPTPWLLGLIATPPARRFARPQLAAWIIRPTDLGDIVCERAAWVVTSRTRP